MVIKLRKPHTIALSDKNGVANLVIPANATLLTIESGGAYKTSVSIPCGNMRVELQFSVAKDNAEVVVK